MNTYLGLDFGGTKLLIGEVGRDGRVLRQKKYDTGTKDIHKACDIILSSLLDYRDHVGFEGTLTAAGAGVVGTSDYKHGLWLALDQEPAALPLPLARRISEILGVPAFLDNDVRSAVTGELLFGIGKQSSDFIYLNVGTGLAAGIVSGGKIIRGARNDAGEIGHMVVDASSDYPCECGRKGCAESYVSGIGFTRQAQVRGILASVAAENGMCHVRLLFEKAAAGDKICREIYDYAAFTLSGVIMNLTRTTNPDTMILGGGIMSSEGFVERVKSYFSGVTMNDTKIVKPSFPHQEAGLIGAASVAGYNMKGDNRE